MPKIYAAVFEGGRNLREKKYRNEYCIFLRHATETTNVINAKPSAFAFFMLLLLICVVSRKKGKIAPHARQAASSGYDTKRPVPSSFLLQSQLPTLPGIKDRNGAFICPPLRTYLRDTESMTMIIESPLIPHFWALLLLLGATSNCRGAKVAPK